MIKRTFKYIITFLLIFSILSSIPVSAFQFNEFELNAKGTVLLSLDTDEVLYSQNADQKMYPASLTKMLVTAVVLDNTTDLSSKVTVSKSALNEISGTGASVIGLKVGEELTIEQALYCLLIASGGDVAYVLAEHFGGDTAGFMDMMNKKAVEIGMTASHFGNPVGLHDDETYTTPNDIVKLFKYVLNYPIFKEIVGKARYTLPATNLSKSRILSTTNFLIDPSTNYFYKYCNGGKTGFTDEAGRCVVTTATNGGYTYMCVIMNCDTKNGVQNQFRDSINLYKWAFTSFEYKSVLDITKPVTEIPLELSMDTDYLQLYPEISLKKILPKAADESTITIVPKLNKEAAKAPVTVGTVYGTADIIYGGEVIGTVNLVSRENIKANIILQIGAIFKGVISSTVFKIILILIAAAVVVYIVIVIKLNTDSKKRHRKVRYIPYDKDNK